MADWYREDAGFAAAAGGTSPASVDAAANLAVRGLHVDRSACDTLTNFTSLVPFLSANRVSRVVLCTDSEHMRRALAVGKVVLGSCGIAIEHTVPLKGCPGAARESWLRVLRDVLRALFWVCTGIEGSFVTKLIHPSRL
jgi:hypothetical protein